MDSPQTIKFKKAARHAARKYKVPVSIVFAVIGRESSWKENAKSPKGAASLMQLMPHYGDDRWDPYKNIDMGVKTLRDNYKRWGNWRLALAGYNAGNGAVEKYGGIPPYRETQNYVRNVLGDANKFSDADFGVSPDFKTAKPGRKKSQSLPISMGFGGITLASIAPMIFGGGLPPIPGLAEPAAAMPTMPKVKAPASAKTVLPGPTSPVAKGPLPSASPSNTVGKLPDNLFVGYGGTKQQMGWLVAALKKAKSMGLHVGENTLYDNIDPVHVPRSNHYQLYPGTHVNRGADISGSSATMAAFYRWAKKTYGQHLTELYFDPLGGIKHGREIGAIGNHDDHVHLAF